MNIMDQIHAASQALSANDLGEAARLISEAESVLSTITDANYALSVRANLGGVMIDLGSWTKDEDLLTRGTQYAMEILAAVPQDKLTVAHFYNAANGYSAQWDMRKANALDEGVIDQSHLEAKKFFRKALDIADSQPFDVEADLRHQLLVNYANCLDSVSRSVEAIPFYNRVIRSAPHMGQALGNKGITLHHLAPLAWGHTHLFLLEAHRLIGDALRCPLDEQALRVFRTHYQVIGNIIEAHGIVPEQFTSSEPISPFHEFLRQFCARHELFLTPTTLVGNEQTAIYGDPMFISRMVAPLADDSKFDRYVTFLNQIKQDYVMARYLLIQSQYRSDVVDAIDHDVDLYYPLDYSLHSTYIQMLRTALKLAIDVLDKIAYFIRDYCNVTSVTERQVDFQRIWADQNSPTHLRPELATRKNPYLVALFDLALDLKKDGYYSYINEHRNAMTHRFMVVHDMMVAETNADIPRILLRSLLKECILAMRLARAAVMYLILFVEMEEEKLTNPDSIYGPILGTPVDGVLRWTPQRGV